MKICSTPASVQRRGTTVAGAGLACALALAASGCSSTVERRADAWGGEGAATASRQPIATQGSAWELVFQSPYVNTQLADAGEGPEYSRRDASLNPRSDQAYTALSNWPEGPRPDLARARNIRVRDSESTFIYYLPTGSRSGSSNTNYNRSGWWY